MFEDILTGFSQQTWPTCFLHSCVKWHFNLETQVILKLLLLTLPGINNLKKVWGLGLVWLACLPVLGISDKSWCDITKFHAPSSNSEQIRHAKFGCCRTRYCSVILHRSVFKNFNITAMTDVVISLVWSSWIVIAFDTGLSHMFYFLCTKFGGDIWPWSFSSVIVHLQQLVVLACKMLGLCHWRGNGLTRLKFKVVQPLKISLFVI